MNQKELGELRRRWRPEKNNVSRVYGCYVNSNKSIISDLNEPLALMTQEESEKYLSLLKKTLSGTLGRNLIDIEFTTRQVVDSEEHRLLTALRSSSLQDSDAREAFYQKVIEHLDMGESNYLILLACDSYDVPHRGRDDEVQADASDEVFTYILCCVCPVKDNKLELAYFPGENEFRSSAVGQVVAAPDLGFLFPAFDDRSANIYNALYYARKPDELHQELIDAVFHTEPPMSAGEQRDAFESSLSEALEDDCSMEVVQSLHECLVDKLERHKESKDPEPLAMTTGEVSGILRDCGVEEQRVEAFRERCEEQFGSDAALHPANLVDTGRFQVKTGEFTVSVSPAYSHMMEIRRIDGRKFLLVPVEDDVEINGFPVNTSLEQP
jgi:hypothetical protein